MGKIKPRKFIDAWGRGYKKIREGFEGAGLPMPMVENFCGGVRVTLQRKNVVENTVESTLKSTLKGTKKNIVEIMGNDPTVTIPQIAEQLKLHPRGIAKHVKSLQDQKIIIRVGGDKGGHWEVISSQ